MNTVNYYNLNAKKYMESTKNADMHQVQDRFLKKLPPDAAVLDFGCGSGRDTRYFLDHGLKVTATDGSLELCRLAGDYTGIPVKHMMFKDLDDKEKYDGIWACSSILHLPKKELSYVFLKMCAALKKNGIIYTSFKYGTFEGERSGRYYTDFTEEHFKTFIAGIGQLRVTECWITGDVIPGRENERWLNLILSRSESI